jgi:hypothetical protein
MPVANEGSVFTLSGITQATADTRYTPADAFLPTGAKWERIPFGLRFGMTSAAALVSGRLSFWAGPTLHVGTEYAKVTFISGTTAAKTPEHQWTVLLNSKYEILQKSADLTTTPWAAEEPQVFTFTGYEPGEETPVYVGLVVVAATVPTLIGFNGLVAQSKGPPVQAASANTGLSTPASLTSVSSVAAVGQSVYCYGS